MKILVTGACGQLGYDVLKELGRRHIEAVATDMKETYEGDFSYRQLDITDRNDVFRVFEERGPDAVIHCAAYTAVDAAEEDRDTAFAVNAEGTKNLALAAKEYGIKLLYVSTDYVFDGKGEKPFKADCKDFGPLNVYGLSKLEGERAVRKLLEKYFIVRTSWVFGKNGNNFVKTMLKAAKTHDSVRVVSDQIGSVTYTADLAILLTDMIMSEKYGIYHATNSGACISWYDFCREIYRLSGIGTEVVPVSSAEYKTKALRPLNSRLDRSCLTQAGFSELPDWHDALTRYLKEERII